MIDLTTVVKVFLKNLEYENHYSEQSSASTRAYIMCVPNCISVEEDENYTDDSYPNSDFEVLDEFDEEEIEKELTQLQRYKQIETDIGCPIDVFFRALKDGVYNEGMQHFDIEHYYIGGNSLDVHYYRKETNGKETRYIRMCGISFKISDYKKTWWLKADKSE